jgi:hypothetical protein
VLLSTKSGSSGDRLNVSVKIWAKISKSEKKGYFQDMFSRRPRPRWVQKNRNCEKVFFLWIDFFSVKIWVKISKSEKKVFFTTCFLGVPDHAESKKIEIVKIFFFSSELIFSKSNVTYEVAVTWALAKFWLWHLMASIKMYSCAQNWVPAVIRLYVTRCRSWYQQKSRNGISDFFSSPTLSTKWQLCERWWNSDCATWWQV